MRQSLLWTLISLACLPSNASAVEFGVGAHVLGINHSLTGDLPDDGKWKGRSSLGGGVQLELQFTEDIALSFQPAYTPRNARQEFVVQGETLGWNDYELDYLSLPLLVRVTSDPGGVRGFVTSGLNVGYLLDSKARNDLGETIEVGAQLKDFTLGALFGAGAMFPVRDGHSILLEFRYEQGLEDIVDRDAPTPFDGLSVPSVRYRGLILQLSYLFSTGAR